MCQSLARRHSYLMSTYIYVVMLGYWGESSNLEEADVMGKNKELRTALSPGCETTAEPLNKWHSPTGRLFPTPPQPPEFK